MAWCGIVCGVVWYGIECCGMVRDVVWYSVWCGMMWHRMVWCGTIYCAVAWCVTWYGIVCGVCGMVLKGGRGVLFNWD